MHWGVFSTLGDIISYINVGEGHWEKQFNLYGNPGVLNISRVLIFSSHSSWYTPGVLKTLGFTHDIPHCTHDIARCTHGIPSLY